MQSYYAFKHLNNQNKSFVLIANSGDFSGYKSLVCGEYKSFRHKLRNLETTN